VLPRLCQQRRERQRPRVHWYALWGRARGTSTMHARSLTAMFPSRLWRRSVCSQRRPDLLTYVCNSSYLRMRILAHNLPAPVACQPGSYSGALAGACIACPPNSGSASGASGCTCLAGYASGGTSGPSLFCGGAPPPLRSLVGAALVCSADMARWVIKLAPPVPLARRAVRRACRAPLVAPAMSPHPPASATRALRCRDLAPS
jgi:hypothetical protein